MLTQIGIPAPEPQFEVFDEQGRFVGRVDFAWKALRTIGEFDGMIKYGRLATEAGESRDLVYQEKLREDALRDLGWQVVRWTWSELGQPQKIAERLRRAFARARFGVPFPFPTLTTVRGEEGVEGR